MFVFDDDKLKEAIDSKLQEEAIDSELQEDIIDLKKNRRTADEAKKAAVGAAILGFNPLSPLYDKHVIAKKKALTVFKNEFKDAKHETDKFTLATNFITDGVFVYPKSGYLIIGVHAYLAGKKNILQRFFTGSMGNWFTRAKMLGVTALQTYVKEFAGKAFADQVNKKTVFNAISEENSEGKVSYFCALKIPNLGK